jgi:hypothetical protein
MVPHTFRKNLKFDLRYIYYISFGQALIMLFMSTEFF